MSKRNKEQDTKTRAVSKGLSDIVKKRKKVEENHTRRTFLVKNELLERLNELEEIKSK